MNGRNRILIIGASGMLGHKLAQVLAPEAEVVAAVRGDAGRWPAALPVAHVAGGLDIREPGSVRQLLDTWKPDIVLNAAGVVKQVLGGNDPADTVAINAVYPNVLAVLCESRGIRLVHYSTDCVFTGASSGQRGLEGYRETDQADSRDLYGMTKLVGEPACTTTLTIRTSMIGRELRGFSSLVEWFLAQGAGTVKGYRHALFTGMTTLELSRVTAMILRDHPALNGVWHVAAPAISKYDLLQLVKSTYQLTTAIAPETEFYCDRRLDGSRFRAATGWTAPPWPDMIQAMQADPLDYASIHNAGSLK